MATISPKQIHKAYTEAVEFHKGNKKFADALKVLVHSHGMNLSSARDYLLNFKKMMSGECYKRTMSAYGTEYFLENIKNDFGEGALSTALSAVDKHIVYYESLHHGKKRKVRGIYEKYAREIAGPSFDEYVASLEKQINESQKDSSTNRKKRIRKAPKKPEKSLLSITVYRRNADVVAEVLTRASGTCEACSTLAPFIRAKDGTPYLEVHHVEHLADGGDDTVENAEALCPNCHREKHYGV